VDCSAQQGPPLRCGPRRPRGVACCARDHHRSSGALPLHATSVPFPVATRGHGTPMHGCGGAVQQRPADPSRAAGQDWHGLADRAAKVEGASPPKRTPCGVRRASALPGRLRATAAPSPNRPGRAGHPGHAVSRRTPRKRTCRWQTPAIAGMAQPGRRPCKSASRQWLQPLRVRRALAITLMLQLCARFLQGGYH
jgi:hypothetical protein